MDSERPSEPIPLGRCRLCCRDVAWPHRSLNIDFSPDPIRKPLLYPSELRGHGRTVSCAATRCERATSEARERGTSRMYTRVYTTTPRSGPLALLEHAPRLALDEALSHLRVAHGRRDR